MERYIEYQKASEVLFKDSEYNNCCTCLYYSALHRMMYAIVHDPQHPRAYDDLNPLDENLHKRIFSSILNKITNKRDEDIIKDSFNGLFDLRHIADYNPDSLTQDDAFTAKQLHSSLMGVMRNRFPL